MKIMQKSRGVTLGALALALGAAVYMNWNLAQGAPKTVGAGEKTAAEVAAVTEDEALAAASAGLEEDAAAVYDPLETGTDTAANKNYGEAQLVSVNQDSGSEFFEAARLARSKARDEALDAIKKSLKSAGLSEEEKTALTTELETQVSNMSSEANVENLIKARGFADCVVTLGPGKADITVMTENDALTADEVTRIRDIVLGQCRGLEAQDITIVEVK